MAGRRGQAPGSDTPQSSPTSSAAGATGSPELPAVVLIAVVLRSPLRVALALDALLFLAIALGILALRTTIVPALVLPTLLLGTLTLNVLLLATIPAIVSVTPVAVAAPLIA